MTVEELFTEEVRKLQAIDGGIDRVYMTQTHEGDKFAPFIHAKLQQGHSVRVYPLFHVHKAVIGISVVPDGGGFKIVQPEE